MDRLDNQLIKTESLMAIDFSTIDNRLQLIDFHLRMVRRYYSEDMSPDMGMKLSKYKGVGKVYKRFVGEYSNVLNEHKSIVKQAQDLRSSMNNFEIKRDQFKEYFEIEMAAAEKNHQDVTKVCGAVPQVEPEYQRLSVYAQNILDEMAESIPELKRAIADRESQE